MSSLSVGFASTPQFRALTFVWKVCLTLTSRRIHFVRACMSIALGFVVIWAMGDKEEHDADLGSGGRGGHRHSDLH